MMSTASDEDRAMREALERLCAGLPVNPLPPPRHRDETLPHAPTRPTTLDHQQRKVPLYTSVCVSSILTLPMLYNVDPNFERKIKKNVE